MTPDDTDDLARLWAQRRKAAYNHARTLHQQAIDRTAAPDTQLHRVPARLERVPASREQARLWRHYAAEADAIAEFWQSTSAAYRLLADTVEQSPD